MGSNAANFARFGVPSRHIEIGISTVVGTAERDDAGDDAAKCRGDDGGRMRVAVGSTNPAKVGAVEAALAPLDPTVESVDVDSGVAAQPRSTAETMEGAANRARRALAAAGADYGVGLEGGVVEREGSGLYLVMWGGATDGARLERGGGPSLRLPDRVADRVRAGEELGPVLDDLLGTDGLARREGAIGVFTGGLTSRREALEEAVACAFGPLVVDHYR